MHGHHIRMQVRIANFHYTSSFFFFGLGFLFQETHVDAEPLYTKFCMGIWILGIIYLGRYSFA